MPKVYHVTAQKDYPKFGIKRGDLHYVWNAFRQGTHRSLTPPTRSQLTGSAFKRSYYDLVDVTLPACASADDLRSLAEEIRGLAQEQDDNLSNIPDNFQDGAGAEVLRQRSEQLEEYADEIESAADELGDEPEPKAEGDSEDDDEESYEDRLAAVIEDLTMAAPDPE